MQEVEEIVMVGIGELLWDILPEGKQMGGAPANFAYHARQLGNRGVVVSSVGDDDNGKELLRLLEKKKIPHLVTTNALHPTSTVSIEMNGNGIPLYEIHESTAWDHLKLDERHVALAKSAAVVCYGTLAQRNKDSADAVLQFLSHTSPGCKRLFDINLRQEYYSRKSIQKLLELSNVVKLNDEELIVIGELFDIYGSETEILEQLEKAFELDLIILTKGENGSRLFSSAMGDSIFNGVRLDVVDTIGAGDSFAAAVATGICRDLSIQDTHLLATRVAAFVCQHAGATPIMPNCDRFF